MSAGEWLSLHITQDGEGGQKKCPDLQKKWETYQEAGGDDTHKNQVQKFYDSDFDDFDDDEDDDEDDEDDEEEVEEEEGEGGNTHDKMFDVYGSNARSQETKEGIWVVTKNDAKDIDDNDNYDAKAGSEDH